MFSNASTPLPLAPPWKVVASLRRLDGETVSSDRPRQLTALRLYEPSSGSISIDGHPIDSLSLSSLQGAIGFVAQDVIPRRRDRGS